MIIADIIGGLGNQMFQYAAARALTLRKGVPLKLDISAFASYKLHHGFELARVFDHSFDTARSEDIRKTLGWQSSKKVRSILSKCNLGKLISKRLVVEPSFDYWEGINEVPDNCYLTGYWQSEKYFSTFTDQIRHDFTFRGSMNNLNAAMAQKILSVNAVSIHIRRGDYLSNKKANITHGLCSLQYYKNSIEYISRNISNPNFFIFSDDMFWAQKNIKIDWPCFYVNHNNGLESYNDMRLMSLCKHNIIANSSFSWWGAWLNKNQRKIVTAPTPWFNDPSLNTKDLLPSEWVTFSKT